jgi:hypothetical protein
LAAAEAKEAEAALQVAKTEATKKKAAEALAKAEGVQGPEGGGVAQHDSQAAFTVSWDQDLFAEAADLDFAEGEKAELERVKAALEELKKQFDTKEPQVKALIERARTVRKAQEERLKKKRKGGDGQATPPAAGEGERTGAQGGSASPGAGPAAADGGGAAASAAAAAEEGALKTEAARLTAARFAAQTALGKGKDGKGGGSQARAASH